MKLGGRVKVDKEKLRYIQGLDRDKNGKTWMDVIKEVFEGTYSISEADIYAMYGIGTEH